MTLSAEEQNNEHQCTLSAINVYTQTISYQQLIFIEAKVSKILSFLVTKNEIATSL